VKAEGVDAGKMAMVVPNDLVSFEIPTFYHLSQAHVKGWVACRELWKRRTLSSPHEKRYG
jgi:hypothetical protein